MKPHLPPKPSLHPIIQELVLLRQRKGWSWEEVRDLLAHGVLASDPPKLASLYQWSQGTVPRGDRLVAIQDFIRTHHPRRKKHIK